MDTVIHILEKIQSIVWGPPTLVLLIGTGLYFTFRLGFLQIVHLPRAIRYIFEKEEGLDNDDGDVSAFASLCTTLAATIGTGSIVGVATALRAGGPGALFWMWVSAFVGMTTKYAEGLLAVKYRTIDENGQVAGGPMYYIQNGLGKNWVWLAKIFALFGVITALLGCGTFPQVNAITESTSLAFNIPIWIIGILVTIAVACVILGGINSISKVAEFIVPLMALFYVIGSLIIIFAHIGTLPSVFKKIFESAFNPYAMFGGLSGTVIISVMSALRTGVARGIYTNEAGLGSSPIVVAAAKTNSCVRQGLISMTSVFFTTIIICTMTGIVIMSSGLLDTTTLDGSFLSNAAYNSVLPYNIGMYIVSIGLIFFSFTTIIGWCYYGERCLSYLVNSVNFSFVFKIAYIVCIAVAPYLSLKPIWLLADITNALMAFPNLIGLLVLSPVVISETKKFFKEEKNRNKKSLE
ncbi:MAG: sodium:alanine symporter family protein [Tyzzerella sp.]|uniref:Sodium:alanine symporter family protein n=1 Tax=Candidatus Fimicola merdigallinarum TaxID=2840819 RepID=A0A9D9DZ97_9FIRM|nr:sodium:alanine symporter family protein [Candidatus Fimicola merdigallinarum]